MQCLHTFFESWQRAGVGYVELCEIQSLSLLVVYQGHLCTNPGLCRNSSVETISTIDVGEIKSRWYGQWSSTKWELTTRADSHSLRHLVERGPREAFISTVIFWTIADIDRGWVSDVTHPPYRVYRPQSSWIVDFANWKNMLTFLGKNWNQL